MTYCLGMLLRDGLIMMADTRTNAGIDNLATYRKLRVEGQPGKSLIAIASSGSLSTTQIAMERAREGFLTPDRGIVEQLAYVPRIHRAAFLLGQAIHKTACDWRSLTDPGLQLDASLLVGGSIGGEATRLFMIYGEGNFIECLPETPYLQIGERKFGQPILDRGLTYETELYEALTLGLISFSATIRSNHAVDLPIDVVMVRSGQTVPELNYRIPPDDDYYRQLDGRLSEAIGTILKSLPRPPYAASPGPIPAKVRGPKAVENPSFEPAVGRPGELDISPH
jgi:putative proteasome-type protease